VGWAEDGRIRRSVEQGPDRRPGHLAALQGRLQQAENHYGTVIREMDDVAAERQYLVATFDLAMLDKWHRADPA
jgi:hypothetical protein